MSTFQGPEFTESSLSSVKIEHEPVGELLDTFHSDFISFISIAQFHKIPMIHAAWDTKLKELGVGATGEVRQTRVNREMGFAFKKFKDEDQAKLFRAVISEMILLRQTQIRLCPHIVELEAICFDMQINNDKHKIWPVLVFKKAQHGSLSKFIESERGRHIGFVEKLKICVGVGSAVLTMHNSNIIHGDIKPENILVFDSAEGGLIAKVTDFGYSCFGATGDDIVLLPKTERWCAPEWHPRHFTIRDAKKTDIYSFGMICAWLLFSEDFATLRDELAVTEAAQQGAKVEARQQFQRSVVHLASKTDHLDSSGRDKLAQFFEYALCENHQARKDELKDLILLFGQGMEPMQEFEDYSRRRTLADYGFTVEDIKNPLKLRQLVQRLFNEMHVNGEYYRFWRDFLDPNKFEAMPWQQAERTINLVLEGNQKFAIPSAEQDSSTRDVIAHGVFNITANFYQLTLHDHRVRQYIAKCLESRARANAASKSVCKICLPQAAFELSVCYTIGFGMPADNNEAHYWLEQSSRKPSELEKEIDHLRRVTGHDIMSTNHEFSRFEAQGISGIFVGHSELETERREAEEFLEREIKDLESVLGKGHALGLELTMRLLQIKDSQGKTHEAEALGWKYKLACEEMFGPENPGTIIAMLLLSKFCAKRNEWDEAEKLALAAKEVLVKNVGYEHENTLAACEDLAEVYMRRGKVIEAENEIRQLKEILEKVRYPSHRSVLNALQWHATLLESRGEWREAEALRSQAWTEWNPDETIPQTDLLRLTERHNHGWYLMRQGDLQGAEKVLSLVKEEAEGRLGLGHLTTMMATRNLALTYRNQGKFSEAEKMQVGLKKTIEAALGPGNPETLNVAFDLARTYQMQEKWADAVDLQLRVKEGREKALGPYHEDTILVSSILAEIYTELGELEEAEAAVLATKTGDEKRLGVVQEPTIRAVRDLGILYLKLGLYQRAEGLLTTVKAMYEERFGLEHEETLGAMSNIAKVYQCQNRFEEAEKELLKSKEYMERVLGQDHKYTKITTNNLVQMYLEQGRIQEAMTIFLPKDQHCSTNSVSLQQGCEDVDSEEMLKAAIKMSLQPDSDLSEEDQDDMLELERAIELSLRNDDD